MISALLLQLIQATVNVPSANTSQDVGDDENDESKTPTAVSKQSSVTSLLEFESVALASFDKAAAAAHTFLNAFLNKYT